MRGERGCGPGNPLHHFVHVHRLSGCGSRCAGQRSLRLRAGQPPNVYVERSPTAGWQQQCATERERAQLGRKQRSGRAALRWPPTAPMKTHLAAAAQVFKAVLKDADDRTELALLYANQTPDDILLFDELQALAADPRLRVHYTGARPRRASLLPFTGGPPTAHAATPSDMCRLNVAWEVAEWQAKSQALSPAAAAGRPSGAPALAPPLARTPRNGACARARAVDRVPEGVEWAYSTGFVSEAMVREHLFPAAGGALAVMCGPPPMIKFACLPNLAKAGYPKDLCVSF